jgi:hypothetical protein
MARYVVEGGYEKIRASHVCNAPQSGPLLGKAAVPATPAGKARFDPNPDITLNRN